jgi:hypothetical protein
VRTALITYHLVNLIHVLFYAVIFMALIDAFGLGWIMQRYVYHLLAIYFILYLSLNFFARSKSNNQPNPITRIALANWLHAGSIAVFALSFYLYFRVDPNYVYIMLVSFPMDIFAVVIAYRKFPVNQVKKPDSLDL